MISKKGLYKKLVIDHFDKAVCSNYYDIVVARRKEYNAAVDAIVVQYLKMIEARMHLDAGCGTGIRALHYEKSIAGLQLTGIDISPKMVLRSKQNGLLDVHCGSIEKMGYKSASFDSITCLFFVLCYLSSWKERLSAIRELSRVLKAGGILFIDCIMRSHNGEANEYFQNGFQKTTECLQAIKDGRLPSDKVYSVRYPDGTTAHNYFHVYKEWELYFLFRLAGLKVIDKHVIGYNSGIEYAEKKRGQRLFILQKSK